MRDIKQTEHRGSDVLVGHHCLRVSTASVEDVRCLERYRSRPGESLNASSYHGHDTIVPLSYSSSLSFVKSRTRMRNNPRANDFGTLRSGTPINLAITVDGPRGPRGKIKRGALDLALEHKIPILPLGVAGKKEYVFKKSFKDL